MSVAEMHKSGAPGEHFAARFWWPPTVSFLTHYEFASRVRRERVLECRSLISAACLCLRYRGRFFTYRIGDDADAVIADSSVSSMVKKD